MGIFGDNILSVGRAEALLPWIPGSLSRVLCAGGWLTRVIKEEALECLCRW